jgi:hypothetical protein
MPCSNLWSSVSDLELSTSKKLGCAMVVQITRSVAVTCEQECCLGSSLGGSLGGGGGGLGVGAAPCQFE